MKISIVGAGNGGCFTALHFAYWTKESDVEVELVYNPDIKPERVGQATFQEVPELLCKTAGFNWYNNSIHATPKSGILYEGWGKVNDKWFHPFRPDQMAMHFCPWEMQRYALECGLFKVIEDDVDPKEVDADYVFDCRGKPDDYSDYKELINPTNACILAKPNWDTTEALWSRHVATPDGWTFVIPTHKDSPSHDYCVGYCYNSNITSREDAEKNLLEIFDVEVKKHLNYKNYMAKSSVIDDRIIRNGNRLFFLEPLESSSVDVYLQVSRFCFDYMITKKKTLIEMEKNIRNYIEEVQNFVLWHYHFGSIYDTPFWDYAKTLRFRDPAFNSHLSKVKKLYPLSTKTYYGSWNQYSIKNWHEGMNSTQYKNIFGMKK